MRDSAAMKQATRVLLTVFFVGLGAPGSHELPGGETTMPSALSPPSIEISPPAPKGPVADNSRCFVCHANYDFNDEKLAFTHAQANIGCVRCHGESSRHSTDEDGLTAPDKMFPLAHVRFNCLGCHSWVKLIESDKKKTDRKEKVDHQAVLAGTAQDKRFCTDCHGEHRLSHRTRIWNRRTGQLISKDATPRMLSDPSGLK